MKRLIATVLCAAICLSGCSSSGSSGSVVPNDAFDGLGDAIAAMVIGGVVVVAVAAHAIYKHQHRNIVKYQPGLNIVPDKNLRAGKIFRVRAIVADEKGKVAKAAFDQATVAWSLLPASSDTPVVEPMSRPSMAGGEAAEFRVEAPGTYRVTFKVWPKGTDTTTAPPEREGTAEITVK